MLKLYEKSHLGLMVLFIFYGCTSIEKAESLFLEDDKQSAFEMAVSLMEEEDTTIRLRAIKLIGKVGGDRAGELLLLYLHDTDTKIQNEIILTLGRLKYIPALENLIDLIIDSDTTQYRFLVSSFRSYGKKASDKLVYRFRTDPETSNLRVYKEMLISFGPDVAPSIIEVIKGKTFFENREYFEILEKLNNSKVTRLMIPFLKDEEVADQVAEAMGRLGSVSLNETIDALNQMKNENTNIKMLERLIRILGVLKDPRAVETLESFSQHSNKRIRNAIDRTLFQIRGY